MITRWVILTCVLVAALTLNSVAHAERRIALLIGNADYATTVGPLDNPVNDVSLIRQTLLQTGFAANDIQMVTNANRTQMLSAVDAFAQKAATLSPNDIAFFYYAGHGAKRPGETGIRLIPTDASNAADLSFWYDTVPLEGRVLKAFQDASTRAAFILAIDACRNELRLPTRTLGEDGTRSFAVVPSSAGMLISYAADENQTARDFVQSAGQTKTRNSPYALALIEEFRVGGRSLSSTFGAIRPNVMARTGYIQQPVLTNKLNRDPVLIRTIAPNPIPTPTPEPVPIPNPSDRFVDARTVSASTRAPIISGDPADLPDFALFRECDACPDMVVVPAGRFVMGSPDSEEGRWDDEGPVRTVSISRFAVSRFEVTWAEWERCVSAGGCDNAGPVGKGGDEGWGKGNRPVINVSWNDAQAYVSWLSRETGEDYRLLSEAEWEYAARAGTTTRFSWGDGNPVCDEQSRFGANFGDCSDDRTRPVGSFPSNSFGLYDMHGNVWEWVEDCWNASYSGAPTNGSARTTGDCSNRVYRGGSWYYIPRFLRSADRGRFTSSGRSGYMGFRVARTLP